MRRVPVLLYSGESDGSEFRMVVRPLVAYAGADLFQWWHERRWFLLVVTPFCLILDLVSSLLFWSLRRCSQWLFERAYLYDDG